MESFKVTGLFTYCKNSTSNNGRNGKVSKMAHCQYRAESFGFGQI